MVSYVSIGEFRQFVRTEAVIDVFAQFSLDAAGELLDQELGRELAVAGSATTRRFVPDEGSDTLFIPDFTSVTSVVEDDTTVAAADYQLEPVNAAARSMPYTRLVRTSGVWFRDGATATVEVTATWGWPAIPARIKMACLLIAKDIYGARDAGSVDYSWVLDKRADLLTELRDGYARMYIAAAG